MECGRADGKFHPNHVKRIIESVLLSCKSGAFCSTIHGFGGLQDDSRGREVEERAKSFAKMMLVRCGVQARAFRAREEFRMGTPTELSEGRPVQPGAQSDAGRHNPPGVSICGVMAALSTIGRVADVDPGRIAA
jgi:hypothetical protein